MPKLFGNGNNDEQCTASGWPVRLSSVRRDGGKDQQCPAGDHKVRTQPVEGRPGAVAIATHRTRR